MKDQALNLGGLLLGGMIWLDLIAKLSVEWLVNRQYSFGWAAPVGTIYLVRR